MWSEKDQIFNVNAFNGVINMQTDKKNRNIELCILACLMLSPALCFAAGGDTTFNDIVTKLKDWLGGSLGFMFVLISFVGAAASVVGAGNMRTMFTVFALCVALHYGPGILEDIFGASGSINSLSHPQFSFFDLLILMGGTGLAIFAKSRYGQKEPELSQISRA